MAKIKDIELANKVDELGFGIINDVLAKAGLFGIIDDMDDYNKIQFNDSLDAMKKNQVRYAKGKAVALLDIVREYDLVIDSRIYNMMRYLELNR